MSPDVFSPTFTPMAAERRMLSASIMDAASTVLAAVPPHKSGVFIAGVDIRHGEPRAVVMIGQKLNETWAVTFVYTGSKSDGHAVSATVTGSW